MLHKTENINLKNTNLSECNSYNMTENVQVIIGVYCVS